MRELRRWLLVPVLAAVAALTGCVGIPSSGPVQAGDVVGDAAPPDFEVLPDGPTPGSDPLTLLSDFMQAVRSPANNFAIAHEFMTPAMAEQWNPNAATWVRRGGAEITPGAGNDLVYSFTSSSLVDERGRFTLTPPTSQVFTFSFEQVGGEWRISSAPPGIVLTQNSFDVVFKPVSLYFFDPGFEFLVPDVRWVPIRARVNDRVVRLLLEGPAEWLAQSVINEFPDGSALAPEGVVVNGSTATVALSAEAAQADAEQLARMRQQLAVTLGVATVELSFGGGVGTSGPASSALVDPQVDGTVLVGTGSAFGFASGDEVLPVGTLSSRIVAAGADAVTLLGQRVAALRADGVLYRGEAGSDGLTALDPALPEPLPPSIDPYGFVWAVPASSAAGLTVYGPDGLGEALPNGLPVDARVVSLDVSRDGTRLLVSFINTVGQPELWIYGIVRGQDGVPVALGSGLPLLLTTTPIDAAWVDESNVVVLAGDGGEATVTAFEVGGPSTNLGTVAGAVQVVGGNQGTDGIRVLTADGDVLQTRGRTWQSTGITAAFLGVQQGRDR